LKYPFLFVLACVAMAMLMIMMLSGGLRAELNLLLERKSETGESLSN